MKKRSQIEQKYKWNLSDIYADERELKEDIAKLAKYPEIVASYKDNNCKEGV